MTDSTLTHAASRRLNLGLGAFICLGTLGASILLAVAVGAVPIPLPTVVSVLANKLIPGVVETTWTTGASAIVWEIRFPRALLAALVGVGLGLVGAALQAVTRNPLADPHLLGISSGAAFGAILALLHTGLFLGLLTVPLLAFGGALVAATLVVGVAQLAGATSADRLVLAGVAVSFIVMAGANVLIFLGDPRATHTVVFWMLGGLGLAQWAHLIWPLAVLVPIVASQGGNAATQTMTIVVRALATRELTPSNSRRIIAREVMVGAVNGLGFGLITGVVAGAWFGLPGLAVVMTLAMLTNLVCGALGGILTQFQGHFAETLLNHGSAVTIIQQFDNRGRQCLRSRGILQ